MPNFETHDEDLWNPLLDGTLPDDDDVASAPQPVFSGDYGEAVAVHGNETCVTKPM